MCIVNDYKRKKVLLENYKETWSIFLFKIEWFSKYKPKYLQFT